MADTLDIITLVEGYRAINDETSAAAGTGDHDTELAQWITAISRRIDKKCGAVVNRTLTSEQHPGGGRFIIPRHRPVSSISAISEYDGTSGQALAAENLAGGTATGFDYFIDPDTSFVRRHCYGRPSVFAPTRVILTYVAGRAANTGAVDALFKTAAATILRRLWSREAGAWARGGNPMADEGDGGSRFFKAVDPIIAELLGGEMGYGSIGLSG